MLLDVDLLLLDVNGHSDLNGLLNDNLLEDWNLDGNGDGLGNLNDLVYRHGDILGDLKTRQLG